MENITEKMQENSWMKTNFSDMEGEIIKFWRENNIVDKILERVNDYPEKVFLDGPPFATGLMHYGHILVSTIKDILNRFFTMSGFKVDKRNSWDCHGVPIEMLAKKIIGYNTKKELLDYGIDKHNDVCRSLVLKCANQWYKDFERIGRWIDIKNEYKTMDTNFMESVIWAFKTLYDKEMIFEGYKVMPYSTGCNTALSHFEAKQNYKDVIDPSVTCMFEIISDEHSNFKLHYDHKTYALAWTTTPWTLPGNMALCTYVNGEIIYLFDKQFQCYILVSKHKFESSLSKLKHQNLNRFEIITRISSDELINMEYKPPFDYYWNRDILVSKPIESRAFRIIADYYVKESGQDSGTGFVHNAGGHGEDDFRVCCLNGIIDKKDISTIINLIDDDGCYVKNVHDYHGIYVKNANQSIIKFLKENKLLFDSKQYTHSYPYCYRTDTPLLYRIVSGWFLGASDEIFREKMLTNNSKINWMPSNIGTNSFDNWLQGSVDWCISRSRYWGTPIPIWKSDDGLEIICVGSINELEKLSGVTGITDLHIEYIDKIKIPSQQGRGMLSRVEGVLDCWFESGSMPYGQIHYPFENKELIDRPLEKSRDYIADFITESRDQTRGWFYTLTVLSTAIFNKPAFKNVIVTGIINGSDGQKMSKNKGNYPDPNILIDKYGADTLRLYLLSTPVVKAESIKFDEQILSKLQQNSVVKIYNMVLFLIEKIELFNDEYPDDPISYPNIIDIQNFNNILDKWIINKTGILFNELFNDFNNYKINTIGAKIIQFIEQMTNWYLKLSRERMKGIASLYIVSQENWRQTTQTLLYVLSKFVVLVCPVMPFICETIYQMLKPYLNNTQESIHFESYPKREEFIIDSTLENKFDIIQEIITMVRELRGINKFDSRRPLEYVEIACKNITVWNTIQDVLEYILIEGNILQVRFSNFDDYVIHKIEANVAQLSSYLKEINEIRNMKKILNAINEMTHDQINEFINNHEIELFGIKFCDDHLMVKFMLKITDTTNITNTKITDNITVKIGTEYTSNVEKEHVVRLINTAIQMHRKKTKLKPWNIIQVYLYTSSDFLKSFIEHNLESLMHKNIKFIKFVDSQNLLKNSTTHDVMNYELIINSIFEKKN
ncbi:isoleucyl-tRNA synthetase [Cotonvirus japonicus]|uniref:isoleucine--tRNA ligase n=1 Tax=Cotonvirus japonicus TaxID=2811091 RepID=A0ABM7NS79_9VIRU|nr:isoleucyl-tRNA synthetase [Cotonvirus japonicus]BCS83013.1 isoleucyl-tRNA synthetase [Cotonvirus japonicus]